MNYRKSVENLISEAYLLLNSTPITQWDSTEVSMNLWELCDLVDAANYGQKSKKKEEIKK